MKEKTWAQYLEEKEEREYRQRQDDRKKEVLAAVIPALNAFGITDVDYVIEEKRHVLIVEGVQISSCEYNSIQAIMQEVAGYIFAKRWIPTHRKKNDPCIDSCVERITEHWKKEEK